MRKGSKASLETRKKMSDARKGKKRGNFSEGHKAKIAESHWKNNLDRGINIFKKVGVRWIVSCRKRKIEFWARIVYQNYFLNGSEIPKGLIVHHKDLNPENDSPDNLLLCTRAEHQVFHRKGKKASIETRKKSSESHLGKKASLETRMKLSEIRRREDNPNRGKVYSLEQRKNCSDGKKKWWNSASLETKQKMSESAKEGWRKRKLREEKEKDQRIEI